MLEAQQAEQQAALDTLTERIRQQQLADAQIDGEKALRTTSERLQKDLEELEARKAGLQALDEARRAIHTEAQAQATDRSLDQADALAQEKHERRASIQLAVRLAEEERQRRVGEFEHERLNVLAEELDERHANQRQASSAVEGERARRMFDNPLGSPFARPGTNGSRQFTDEQLDEEMRRAASLVADQAAKEEKARRLHESYDEETLVHRAEQLDRTLAQQSVRLATEDERQRRILEAEANTTEEEASRRRAIALAKAAVQAEQDSRISAVQRERGETDLQTAQARTDAQLKAIEWTEQERQAQIANAATTPKGQK